jgi:hypothetical protein
MVMCLHSDLTFLELSRRNAQGWKQYLAEDIARHCFSILRNFRNFNCHSLSPGVLTLVAIQQASDFFENATLAYI